MKLVGKHGLSWALEILVWVLIACAVAAIVAVPWLVDWMMELNVRNDMWDASFWRPRYMVTLGVSGGLAALMLWQMRCILHNINSGTIFSDNTVFHMKVLGVEALVVSFFYVVMLFCGMTKFSIGLIALVFAFAGLIVLVFAELFRQATVYKQENDMTI